MPVEVHLIPAGDAVADALEYMYTLYGIVGTTTGPASQFFATNNDEAMCVITITGPRVLADPQRTTAQLRDLLAACEIYDARAKRAKTDRSKNNHFEILGRLRLFKLEGEPDEHGHVMVLQLLHEIMGARYTLSMTACGVCNQHDLHAIATADTIAVVEYGGRQDATMPIQLHPDIRRDLRAWLATMPAPSMETSTTMEVPRVQRARIN